MTVQPRRTTRSRSSRAAEEEPALERLLVEIERRTRAHPPLFAARTVLREAYWYFRRHGFPHWHVPVHVRLVMLPDERLRTTALGYHIADTYHPHRLATRVHGAATPLESFGDDRRLQLALALTLRYGDRIGVTLPSALKLVHGTQAAANFRPGYALYLYRRYLPREEGTILDTSAGFGGRLVGAICLPRAHYLGIDPSRAGDAIHAPSSGG